jgi:hypothetical protein
MNLLKWVLIFAFAFVVAWVLIFTFTQPPFAEGVPAKIFAYRTPPIPVYVYVTGAFFIGLILGGAVAVYNYITGGMKAHKLNKRVRALETELADLKAKSDIPSSSSLSQVESLPPPQSHSFPDETPGPDEGVIE